MQKSVMDIWTTPVQLRKSNTSHASKWRESIALSVCRGSKVPWQLCFQAGCRSLPPLSPAAQPGHHEVVPALVELGLLSIPAIWQLCSGMLQWWCRKRERLALKVTEVTSFCEHLALEPNCVIVAVAHMQLTEILSFKFCFCKCKVSLLYP